MLKDANNEEALHDWCRAVVEDNRDLRKGHEQSWWEQLCVYAGDLWVEYNVHSKQLEEVELPDHRVRLPINLVSPVVRTEYAKLLKNKPITNCIAKSADRKDRNSAKVGDKLAGHYLEKQFRLPRVRRGAVMWTLITGLGAVFVDYDPSMNGEVEVFVDANGDPVQDPQSIKAIQRYYRDKHKKPKTTKIPQGDLRFKPLGPMQWGWDLSSDDPMDGMWQYVTELMDVDEVYRRWGVEVEPGDKVRPNVFERRILTKVDLTGSFKQFSNLPTSNSQEMVVVHRLFIKPGHRYFPDGAEIVFTEQEIIDATPFPFAHGQLPVSCMGHIPMPGSRYPLSIVGQIRHPVLEISKTESQMIENRNLMSNPPWIEYEEHQIPEGELVNKPGARIKVRFRPNMEDPHPVQMPEMPAYVQSLPEILGQHVQTIAGQGETSQGRVPPGARSGVSIAYLQEEDDTKLGPTVGEFEEMIERMTWQGLSLIAQFYDMPRTTVIYQRHADPEVLDFTGTMLNGIQGVETQAGSALPRSKAAKQQFIMDLYSMGIEQNPAKVKEMLELGEGEPEDFEDDLAQAERENSRLQEGKQQPVEDWFNHQAHLVKHRKFMKSADFEELPENIQQVFRDHDAMHQRFLTGVAQAQQMGVPTPGQTLPQPQLQNGANNQAPVQGGPLAQSNGAPTGPIDAQPQ
jgi:hypothetical protein